MISQVNLICVNSFCRIYFHFRKYIRQNIIEREIDEEIHNDFWHYPVKIVNMMNFHHENYLLFICVQYQQKLLPRNL